MIYWSWILIDGHLDCLIKYGKHLTNKTVYLDSRIWIYTFQTVLYKTVTR